MKDKIFILELLLAQSLTTENLDQKKNMLNLIDNKARSLEDECNDFVKAIRDIRIKIDSEQEEIFEKQMNKKPYTV